MTPGVSGCQAICDVADCKACKSGQGSFSSRWATLRQVRGGLAVFVSLPPPPPLVFLYLLTTPVESSWLGSRALCLQHEGRGGWLNPPGLQGCFTPWQQSEAADATAHMGHGDGGGGERGKVVLCGWDTCICFSRRIGSLCSIREVEEYLFNLGRCKTKAAYKEKKNTLNIARSWKFNEATS